MQDNMKQTFPAFLTYDLATATPLRHNPKSLYVCFHSLKRLPGLGCTWTSHSIVFHLHMLRIPVSRVVTSLTSVTNPCFSRTFIFPHIDIKSYFQATRDSMFDRYPHVLVASTCMFTTFSLTKPGTFFSFLSLAICFKSCSIYALNRTIFNDFILLTLSLSK